MIVYDNFWEYLKEGFFNLIYPLSCEHCEKEIRESKGYSICDNCITQIKFISAPYCYLCGKPLSSMVSFEEDAICVDCYNKKNQLYFNRSIAYYQGVMRKCIHLLKYKKQVKLIKPLGDIMVDYFIKNNDINIQEIDVIIPVPLVKKDYIKRGFNQSTLLAKYLADYFSIPFTENLLFKEKNNISQVGLSKVERENNVKQVYSINLSCTTKFNNILLVDDIYTTGATIGACCRELNRRDIKKIFVITLARNI